MSTDRGALSLDATNRPDLVRVGLIVFAVVNLVIAALLAFAPHFFFDDVGPYGPRNDHYMRDTATWYAAGGVAGLLALRRPSWATPVLVLLALQSGLHTINHLADIGNAHKAWLGPANFVSLLLGTVLLVWLARESTRIDLGPSRNREDVNTLEPSRPQEVRP
jgi:hypothetical protein